MPIEDEIFNLTCSIGISMYPNDSKKPQEILSHADSAMYQAKEAGRNSIVFFNNTNVEKNNG